jgi:hypothetical protein
VDRGLEVLEDELAALTVKSNGAASGQEWEVSADLVDDRAAPCVEDRAQAILETELAAVLANEVDYGQMALAGSAAQSPPELLSEDSW